MSVCNIFKAFDPNNNNGQGIFLTFSQYAEDKTEELSEGSHYRVVPSKFLCLNLDAITDFNTDVPQYLQSEYENRLAFLREYTDRWDSKISRYTLFRTLQKYNLLTITNNCFNEIVCGGDINIISNQIVDGTNYSEIYCLVEPSYKKMQFTNETSTVDDYTAQVSGDWITVIKGWSTDGSNEYPMYPTSSTNLNSDPLFDDNSTHTYSANLNDSDVAPAVLDSTFDDTSVINLLNDDSFEFNCIIVFYDIYNEDIVIDRSLPLGIWFSGPEDDGNILNPVTKFVSSETIFGQGTSYGLRICLKNVSNPFGESYVLPENEHFCELVNPISELCDRFAQASVEMQRIAAESSISLVEMKDWASIFMNSRINVPYIKKIGNTNYWFVNGRNVGPVDVTVTE